MNKTRKLKEAFKVALAFAIVYGIALKVSWMNPSWAGFAVAMIALPTMGQSLHKGLNRFTGTALALIAALIIFSIAPQNRWLFIFLAASWIAFVAYKQINSKNNSYVWYVAGFVCLIILSSAPITSENIFNHALYRALETTMGITVYSLITFFIWPINNKGAIKKTALELLASQLNRIHKVKSVLNGKEEIGGLVEPGQQNLVKLGQLNSMFVAEGSENYNVYEELPHWGNFQILSTSLYECQNRIETYIPELTKCDVYAVLPTLKDFLNELDDRFEHMQRIIKGDSTNFKPTSYTFDLDKKAAKQLTLFEKAAIEVSRLNLQQINNLSMELFNCLRSLMNDNSKRIVPIKNLKEKPKEWFSFPDLDNLSVSLYAGIATFLGFCVWIFFNPTGHAGWFSTAGNLALIISLHPQSKVIGFFKPLALILPLGIVVYVFILPTLSTFWGLGIVLFGCMFLVRYFFTGIAQLAGAFAIINMIAIQNQQQYSVAAMFNGYLFTLAIVVFSYAVTYLINASRPEKNVLKYLNLFFIDAEFLFSQGVNNQEHKLSFFKQMKLNYKRKELRSIPTKIAAWSKAIDHQLYPNITPDQIKEMVTNLEVMVYSIDELFEFEKLQEHNSLLNDEFLGDLKAWNKALEEVFASWSQNSSTKFEEKKKENFNNWFNKFEHKVEITTQNMTVAEPLKEIAQFYRILGGYRGVSVAVIAYANYSKNIDFKQWQEERFS